MPISILENLEALPILWNTICSHLSFLLFIYLFLAVSVSFKGYHLFSVAAGDVKLNILLICVTGGISGSLVSGEVGVI